MENNPHHKNKNLAENLEVEGGLRKIAQTGYYPAPLFWERRKSILIGFIEKEIEIGNISAEDGWKRIFEIKEN